MDKADVEPSVASVVRAFEEGRGLSTFEVDGLINRNELIDTLKKILKPSWSKSFHVIVGQKGVGKTTAIKQALASLEQPRSYVYFDCRDAAAFTADLASAVGYRNVSVEFRDLENVLLGAAYIYKSKHKQPMTFIVDSIDVLAEGDPALFEKVQYFAKDCADSGNMNLVFISSNNGAVFTESLSRSPASRMAGPFEIGEISDDQAVEYLVKKGIQKEEAELAVANVTGGSFVILQNYASFRKYGRSLQQILKDMDVELSEDLSALGVSPQHPFFRELVKNKHAAFSTATNLGMDKDQLDVLVKNNILAMHRKHIYKFHDRHKAMWFKRNAGATTD